MKPLRIIETQPGSFSLLLNEGEAPVEHLIEELGHSPSGYFWRDVARWLIINKAPALEGRFDFDPEAGMFCAYGDDRPALEELGTLMAAVANDRSSIRNLLVAAKAAGFELGA